MVAPQNPRVCGTRVAVILLVILGVGTSQQIQAARHLSYDEKNDPKWPNRKPGAGANQTFGEWKEGRSTFAYNEDGMDLREAACRYGEIDPSEGLGLQIAAISDADPTYPGSCGRCYELKCAPMDFKDGFNETMSRKDACRNDKSLVVRIVDTCPCNYPKNPKSNERWCCGDMTHFDTSYWALAKLAYPRNGVVGVNYREVPCDYAPANNAGPVGLPPNYSSETSGKVGAGKNTEELSKEPAQISASNLETTRNGSITLSLVGNETSAPNMTAPEEPAAGPGEVLAPSGGVTPIYKNGGFQSGWADASWKTGVSKSQHEGLNGGAGFCGYVANSGALAMQSSPGKFKGMLSLQFYVKSVSDTSLPEISVKIASDKGACNAVALSSLQDSGGTDGWSKYDVFLGNFDKSGPSSDQEVTAFAPAFDGCGDIPVGDLSRVEFNNYSGKQQTFCLDQVYLLG